MTFGYDSALNKFWKPNNALDISDFAMQLLTDLWLHYSQNGDVTKLQIPLLISEANYLSIS